MKLGKILKRFWKFIIDNYFISVFLAAIAFVTVFSIYILFFAKPMYIYAKVKVGQGLWWATTAKPNIWFVKAIKKGDIETDLMGKPIAEILSVRYYPWDSSNQYDVYIVLKLRVTGNKKTGKYNFNRSTIGIGAPIDLEFPLSQFSGTIVDLSGKPFKEKFIEKTIYLAKGNGYYKDFSFPYENIIIGDKYFDGVDYIFEVIDKKLQKQIWAVTNSSTGQLIERDAETSQQIIVKAKIKVKEINKQLVYGEDQIVALNRTINIQTTGVPIGDYLITGIE